MRERSDPLVPILGSAVAVVVLGAVGLIFYPRVSAWLEASKPSVIGEPPAPHEQVPVWLAHSPDGVALMLTPDCDAGTALKLDHALRDGPYHYLTLTVYNFDRDEPFVLDLTDAAFASPEGGSAARAAARLVRTDTAAPLQAVLRGLGAVGRLEVAKGRTGTALLVVKDDPARRTAFVNGETRLERRQLERVALAGWRQRPDWEEFKEFH